MLQLRRRAVLAVHAITVSSHSFGAAAFASSTPGQGMPPAKRARWDEEGVLDVQAWLREHPPAACGDVQASQPVQLGAGWTKLSCTAGGSAAERYRFGSTEGLLAFRPPRPPVDLNAGREQYVGKDPNDKGDIEVVVQAALQAGAPLAECDVLTFRNNLNKIFGTPLDPGSSWAVDACWRGSTLFLDIVQLEEQWRGNAADAEKFTFWGYSFEAACTGQASADASSEYGALVRTRVGGVAILLGAEIDCYDPATCVGACGTQQPSLGSYVEIKTYRLPGNPRQQGNLYRHKHPKWYVQSYLAGVPTLALGGRDDQGIVQRLDLVRVADLPSISAAHGAPWSPQQALAFGAACLRWMQGVAAAHPEQQVRFSYDGGSRRVRSEAVAAGDLPARLQRVLGAVG